LDVVDEGEGKREGLVVRKKREKMKAERSKTEISITRQ
jgi:hypothetical protein